MTNIITFPKMGLIFTVNETAFSIGSFDIRWYGIIIALGFLLALIYVNHYASKMNLDMDKFFDAIIVGLIGSVVFARLFYVVFYPGDKYLKNPMEIFRIHEGGLAIYGAIIGALLCGVITARLRKINVLTMLDLVALGFLIGQGIGRWGNFVNQEAFGSPTDLPWGMYSEKVSWIAGEGNPVHPCFLYESLLCLLGFVLLHFFNTKHRKYDGQTFLLYIVWYGVIRFFIEGLRTDSLMILNLRVSQVLAGVSALAGIALLIVFRHRTRLSGCGDPRIMEAVGLTHTESEDDGKSTIFGDLPLEEQDIKSESKDVEETKVEAGEESKGETKEVSQEEPQVETKEDSKEEGKETDK